MSDPKPMNTERLAEELLPVTQMLSDLLAIVHRDGGHRQGEVGLEQAWMEAMMLVPTYLEKADALRTRPSPTEGLAGELARIEHAWRAGYSTGQAYRDDPPFAGLGKHNCQHGWELYACSLSDRNLTALTPASNEAVEAERRLFYIARRIVEDVSSIKYPTKLSPNTVSIIVGEARIVLASLSASGKGEGK